MIGNRKRIFLFATASFLLAALATFAIQRVGPKIVVSDTIEMGALAPKSRFDSTFEIKNTGDETLLIAGMQTSCSCTVIQSGLLEVPPKSAVSVRYAYSSDARPRSVEQSIVISSNDRKSPEKIVTLKGKIESSVTLLPDRVQLTPNSQMEYGFEVGLAKLIVEEPRSSLKLVEVSGEADFISTRVDESTDRYAVISFALKKRLKGQLEIPLTVSATLSDGRTVARLIWVCGRAEPIAGMVDDFIVFNTRTQKQTLGVGNDARIESIRIFPHAIAKDLTFRRGSNGDIDVYPNRPKVSSINTGCIVVDSEVDKDASYCIPVYFTNLGSGTPENE